MIAPSRTAVDNSVSRLVNHRDSRERSDGGDLLVLCQQNLVYRCDLVDGVRKDLLAPFHFFGVPDDVDYTNIPWRSTSTAPAS